jgi:hypothetical protein
LPMNLIESCCIAAVFCSTQPNALVHRPILLQPMRGSGGGDR